MIIEKHCTSYKNKIGTAQIYNNTNNNKALRRKPAHGLWMDLPPAELH